MRLQKVALILGISACLLGTQVAPSVAQIDQDVVEENSQEQEKAAAEKAEAEKAAAEKAKAEKAAAEAERIAAEKAKAEKAAEKAAAEKTEEATKSTENESTESEDRKESSDNAASTEDTTSSEASPETEETEDTENKDGEIKEGEESKPVIDENKGPESEEDRIDESNGTEDSDDAKDNGENQNNKRTEKKKSARDVKAAKPVQNKKLTGSGTKAVLAEKTDKGLGAFNPSQKLSDIREKVKYNSEVPIEDIPSFITQEMIVGALKCQDETGYPASVTIAQVIQESGYGKYGPGGKEGQGLSYLAYQYNNLFGIKGTGTAGSITMNTGEQTSNGTNYRTSAGFRVYNTYTECIEDRTDILNRVYKDLTFGVDDANTFAMKVGSRWATGITYGQNLIKVMEQYDLYRLDQMTVGDFSNLLNIFVDPCPGARLSSHFGHRNAPTAGASTYHKGIDLGTGGVNLPTYAAAAGTVTYAGYSGGAGNLITIDHGNGLVTKYMHHDKIYVKVGDTVEKGQQIGLAGSTGVSTGIHLHFQIERNGVAVDPMNYLDLGN